MNPYEAYLKIVDDGKPISQEVRKALDRVPYYLDHFTHNTAYTDALCKFIEGSVYLQKGGGGLFKLETEQRFWIWLLGFEHDDGTPVITDLPIILGAGSGKSTLMAALALAVMIVGSHQGNDVLVLSNSKEQAQATFRTAQEMAGDERSILYPLKKKELLSPIINKIKWRPTNSQIEIKAMNNHTADGVNVRMAIFDEFHAYTVNVIENIRKSSAPKRKKTGFTTVYISTNGQTRDAVFDTYYKRWEQLLDGEMEDWSTFPMIYKIDDISEATDMKMYPKAMPFINTISSPQIVYDALMKTKGNPIGQSEILAKSFNLPQTEFNALFTDAELEKVKSASGIEWGDEVAVSWDLSAVNDLSTIGLLWKEGETMRFKQHSFLPQVTFENGARVSRESRLRYMKYVGDGELTLIPGSMVKQEVVYEWLENFMRENGLHPIGFGGDAFYSRDMRRLLSDEYGEDAVTTIRQNVMSLSPPLKQIQSAIAGGQFYCDDELSVWSLSNLRVKIDANGNIFPNKQKAADKIDPVLTMIQALYVWNEREQAGDYIL